jgi:predicted TIM-barrel fold metal-dependent hydrolase
VSNGGTDIHQHLWPERLLGALAERSRPPLIRRSGAEWVLRIDGEPEHRFELADHDPGLRAEALDRSGLERAVISLSGPLGIEGLPAGEAAPLLEAFHAGVLELGPRFGAWGSLALRSPDPRAVDVLLDRGFIGVTIPAGALRTREGLDRLYRVLHRLELRGAPLFVHPGPDPLDVDEPRDAGTPVWWPAMTSYIAEMNAAWHAFAAWGRRSHPRLRVVFAMLAGGAPLHLERLVARGGPRGAGADPGLFYDTSSYGERAVDALVRQVGIDQVVYGSDRPVVDPPHHALLGPAAAEAMSRTNVLRVFDTEPQPRAARIAVAA